MTNLYRWPGMSGEELSIPDLLPIFEGTVSPGVRVSFCDQCSDCSKIMWTWWLSHGIYLNRYQ